MSEKRSVHTDALATLGNLIDDSAARDAIHLAVEPVVAGETLYPGQHIGIQDGVAISRAEKKLGIVDPFITGVIPKGHRFWLIVYPRQITSLRHVWEHPDFNQPAKRVEERFDESQKWIMDFAERVGLEYGVLIEGADTWLSTHNGLWGGEYLCFGGLLEGEYVPDEFWEHYEKVRNVKVEENKRGSFFTCSC